MTQTKTPPRSLPTLAATLALVTALSSCTTPAPTTTPSTAAPTFACTPEAGGSPYACSSADYDEMKRKDALYAEAEQVFRRLIAEDERMYRGGGAEVLSAEYQELLGTKQLQAEQLAVVRSVLHEREVARGGEYRIAWIERRPGVARGGSEVTVAGCLDLTSVSYFRRGQFDSKGTQYILTLYVGHPATRAQVVGVDTTAGATC